MPKKKETMSAAPRQKVLRSGLSTLLAPHTADAVGCNQPCTVAMACYGLQSQLRVTQQHIARHMAKARVLDYTERRVCADDLLNDGVRLPDSVVLLDQCSERFECLHGVARRNGASILVNAAFVRSQNDHLCCDYLCIVNGSRVPTAWLTRLYRRFVRHRNVALQQFLDVIMSHSCVLVDMWVPQLYIVTDDVSSDIDLTSDFGSSAMRPRLSRQQAQNHRLCTRGARKEEEWRAHTQVLSIDQWRTDPATSMHYDDCCPICLCEWSDGDRLRRLRCMHCFHVQCIDHFMTTQSRWCCPMCNQQVSDGQDLHARLL